MLQVGQFAALKEREIFIILRNFKPKKITILGIFVVEKFSKIHKIGDFGFKNHQNLRKIQRSIINYSLVLKIGHPVALCSGQWSSSPSCDSARVHFL